MAFKDRWSQMRALAALNDRLVTLGRISCATWKPERIPDKSLQLMPRFR